MIEDQKCKHTDLLHKFQKLEQEHEHLVERNEELELLLGETQNQTKEERKHFEYHIEKLQRKVLKLSRQCEHLNQLAMGVKAADAKAVINPGMSKDDTLEEPSQSLKGERQQPCPELAEGSRQMDMLKEPLKGGCHPKEMEREEHPQQEQDVNAERQQFNSKSEEARLREDLNQLSKQFLRSPSSGDSSDDSSKQSLLEKSLRYQQQEEELQKLRQNLQRVQTLCSSIERELQFERTKNFDLKQQNNLLHEESMKIKAELKQAQKKLLDSTSMCSSITADWESSQQKVRELEQEMLKQSENIQSQSNLYEKLAQEKTRVAYAEKKVLELQEKLEAANESCTKTCILDKKQLEEAVKEARKNEAKLKMQYQEEQQKRKLLDHNVDELQQHIQYLHAKETLMEQSNCKQQFKIEQQEVQLQKLEDEKKRYDEQVKNHQELLEKLFVLQKERDSLKEEYGQFLKQLDVLMRNFNEKHHHHKVKLQKAKERLTNEVEQRDGRIKQLETEVEKMHSLMEKEKAFQDQVTTQNENLLLEKKQLLEKLTERDETIQGNTYTISSVQNRVLFLGEENKLLQENSHRLTQQVGQLERILRSIQVRRGEEMTISEQYENELWNKKLIFPNLSFSITGLAKSNENLKVTEEQKSEELLGSPKSSLSFSHSQPPEVGSLNMASLVGKPSSQNQDRSQDGPNGVQQEHQEKL
uniref:Coiled-coil domain-containing protein 30 isoform X4 n=1 Tax=Phascolarctos cinereus TaxID=38626 RepID=A0A6P5K264_PHACI|nr:coiled-coil domain-containing protein 30 isoform X4 [Phascolarctos cinereus]